MTPRKRRIVRGSDYMTAGEAARRLGCGHPTIHRGIRSGKIKAIKVLTSRGPIYAVQWRDVKGFTPRAYTRKG